MLLPCLIVAAFVSNVISISLEKASKYNDYYDDVQKGMAAHPVYRQGIVVSPFTVQFKEDNYYPYDFEVHFSVGLVTKHTNFPRPRDCREILEGNKTKIVCDALFEGLKLYITARVQDPATGEQQMLRFTSEVTSPSEALVSIIGTPGAIPDFAGFHMARFELRTTMDGGKMPLSSSSLKHFIKQVQNILNAQIRQEVREQFLLAIRETLVSRPMP